MKLNDQKQSATARHATQFRNHRARVIWSALALISLVSVSCGSTVATNRNAKADAGLGAEESGLPEDSFTAEGDGLSGTGASGQSGRGSRTKAAQGSAASGVHDGTTQVKVGVFYGEGGDEALEAAGAGSTAPDMRAANEIMVKHINAKNGIAGRKLIPIYFSVRPDSDRATADQAACEDFIKDRPVMSVISVGVGSDIVPECLSKASKPYVYSGASAATAESFRRYPLKSEPIAMNLDRVGEVLVEGLHAQSYFRHASGSQAETRLLPVKLAVITFDEPAYRDVYNRVLVPGFSSKGVPVSEVRFVRTDAAGSVADVDSAALAFSQRNVTHVAFLLTGGSTSAFFIMRAHAQRYEPRYGFTTGDFPQIVWQDNVRQIAGDSAQAQYRGALGVGWYPLGDVADWSAPDVIPPAYNRCLDVMRDGGMPPRDINYNSLMALACDGFWFLDAALEAGGTATLSASSYLNGMNGLGSGYPPASITSTRFAPDHHDGVGAIRHFAFFDSCSCFRYTSNNIRV